MPTDFAIRIATPADSARLAPLVQAFNGERAGVAGLAGRIAACADVEVALLAERANDSLGFACVQVITAIADANAHATLTELYVRTEVRRQGIGRALVAAAEAYAHAHGAPELWLMTGFENADTQRFYRVLGYSNRALTMSRVLS